MSGNWKDELDSEFILAEDARAVGNEGRARVCARRAAGIAIKEYMSRRGLPVTGESAYDLITRLSELPDIPSKLKVICVHLTMRVSEEFKLPEGVDLVEETHQLYSELFPEMNP
jgi:hypothetical protein